MRFAAGMCWMLAAALVSGGVNGGCSSGLETFSTDVPIEFHSFLTKKYLGKQAWTRRTVIDEKKNIKIEQDQPVVVAELGLQRSGSVTLVSKNGRKRVVYPFHLPRPLTLENYEKELLDVVWFTSPEERYAQYKEKYGTRIADAIRDHKILKDMDQIVAYLAWGPPSEVTVVKRGRDETWKYETPNLKDATIVFRGGRVSRVDGENVSDTEAASRRRNLRRSSSQ